jgi:hypothetical protein
MTALQPRSVGGPATARLTRGEDRSAQLGRGPENLGNRAAAKYRFPNHPEYLQMAYDAVIKWLDLAAKSLF